VLHLLSEFRFKVQGHHSINKSFFKKGKRPKQSLAWVESEAHKMYHFVLNQVLKRSKNTGGLTNYSSSDDWDRFFTRDPRGRKKLYVKIGCHPELLIRSVSLKVMLVLNHLSKK
jgi:hypothetical protein